MSYYWFWPIWSSTSVTILLLRKLPCSFILTCLILAVPCIRCCIRLWWGHCSCAVSLRHYASFLDNFYDWPAFCPGSKITRQWNLYVHVQTWILTQVIHLTIFSHDLGTVTTYHDYSPILISYRFRFFQPSSHIHILNLAPKPKLHQYMHNSTDWLNKDGACNHVKNIKTECLISQKQILKSSISNPYHHSNKSTVVPW